MRTFATLCALGLALTITPAVAAPAKPAPAKPAPKTAPACKKCSTNQAVIPIVFGLPTKDMAARARRGEIKLGGCVGGGGPQGWYCQTCKTDFYQK